MEFGSRRSPGLLVCHGGWEARNKTGIGSNFCSKCTCRSVPKVPTLSSVSKDERTGNAGLLCIHVLEQLPWFVPVEDLPGEARLCSLCLDRKGSNKSTTRKAGLEQPILCRAPSSSCTSCSECGALRRVPLAAAAAQGPAGREFPPFPTLSLPGAGIRGLNKYVPM